MFSFLSHNNTDAVIGKLLKSLSIGVAPKTISAELDKHPDYPNLLALSDVLLASNVENAAYEVGWDDLSKVPLPFIAHTNLNNGDFIIVNNITDDKVIVSNEKWTKHKLSANEFKKIFRGVVLAVERNIELEAKPNLITRLSVIKAPLLAAGVSLILGCCICQVGYFKGINPQIALLTLFKSAGLIISILLLIQSIDSNNPMIQKLCGGSRKTDCNTILSSRAAKVFEGMSWSEVGFFYFAGTWLMLLFGSHSALAWLLIAALNIASLPYTFYSVHYQWRVAKQWCVLCCTVQALLWLEFLALVVNINHRAALTTNDITLIVPCVLLPMVVWMLIKPLFLQSQQLRPLKQQLRKFKYNVGHFKNMVNNQPKYSIPDDEWSIVLGNIEAGNIITMVSNPYCQPCAKAHQELSALLEHCPNLQARIVFTADNSVEDFKTPVVRHLMALNELSDKSIVTNALHDWYEHNDYDTLIKTYPVKLDENKFYKLEKQQAWCKMIEVISTPTTLLNGYHLPKLYRLSDLKYMLE